MSSLATKLKELIFRADRKRREFAVAASNFGLQHKDALIIMADPHTDVILVMQQGVRVPMRFTAPGTGKSLNIVANALHYKNSKTDKSIDQFLLAVDSGLFNLAERRYNLRKRKPLGRAMSALNIGTRPEFEDDGPKRTFDMLGKNSVVDDAKEAGAAKENTDTKDTGPAAAPAE